MHHHTQHGDYVMQLGARQSFMRSVLPYDYAVEYLEATTPQQYAILPDFTMTSTTGFDIDIVSLKANPAITYFFNICGGYYQSTHNMQLRGSWTDSGKSMYASAHVNSINAQIQQYITSAALASVNIMLDQDTGLWVDGVHVHERAWDGFIDDTQCIHCAVFGISNHTGTGLFGSNSIPTGASLRVSRLRVYDMNGDRFRLFPCVKDHVPCFYDELSQQFIASSGSSEFVAGPQKMT